MNLIISTPCVGICSTVYGDDICRGCKRSSAEIIDWNRLDDTRKALVYHRIDKLISTATALYLKVENESMLLEQIDKRQIRLPPNPSTLSVAYYLLREGQSRIKKFSSIGILIKQKYQDISPQALFVMIDNKIFANASQLE